jgi:hypothetical protein
MPKRYSRKKQPKQSKGTEKQFQLLDQLKEIVIGVGTEIREERLLREVGYNVRSGPCRLEGREVLLLDTNASAADRIEVVVEFLGGKNLDAIYIEPRIRRMIAADSKAAGADSAGSKDQAAAV